MRETDKSFLTININSAALILKTTFVRERLAILRIVGPISFHCSGIRHVNAIHDDFHTVPDLAIILKWILDGVAHGIV